MVSELLDLEIRSVDAMTRQQLFDALRPRLAGLPPDLCERLEEQPDGWLRLLLITARLTWALRHLRKQYWTERPARG
jgi:hypothetical protein